jgi:hypothetical protein
MRVAGVAPQRHRRRERRHENLGIGRANRATRVLAAAGYGRGLRRMACWKIAHRVR